MKDFFELINKRQSVRSYDSTKTVEKEKIDYCLNAARLTPSACNFINYFFVFAE